MRTMLSIIIGVLTASVLIISPAGSGLSAPPKKNKPAPETEQEKIDKVVERGVEFLLKRKYSATTDEIELVVLTLAHTGLTEANPRFKEMVTQMLKDDQPLVYHVALKSMALEMVDRIKYQEDIAHCAQALVNYQAMNGQWSYDAIYRKGRDIAPVITKEPPKMIEVITGPSSNETVPTKKSDPTQVVKVKNYEVKRNNLRRPPSGDNSNAQFALLGLRAAARSNIAIPKEVWQDAANWWVKDHEKDGGWAYSYGGTLKGTSYGSMTVAGICGLAISKCYLEENYKEDPTIKSALDWLATNLNFAENSGCGKFALFLDKGYWLFYYIYGIERVGAILDIEKLGDKDWYKLGTEYILSKQAKDGSWNSPIDDRFACTATADTCFAILFLRKATPVLKTNPKETPDNKQIETPGPEEKKSE